MMEQVEASMKRFFRLKRSRGARQRLFDFLDRSRRRQRAFKVAILGLTCLAIALVLGAMPKGRYVVAAAQLSARKVVRVMVGLPTPREEIDNNWRRFRMEGIAESKKALVQVFAKASPGNQRLMRYAGLDPEHGLLRWGNYDRTLLLPSTVFEADDNGRSYRFRPCVDSIWLRQITIQSGVLMFFQVKDGPELAEAIRGTEAIPVLESRQSTNSWGLRGPEPELDAPLRGIVLGDSFMQGMFIGDDETPPECLRHDLESRRKTKVSILNTGHIGYSPEQYYYSLVEYADRFRPHFVVVSVFGNDFAGEIADVVSRGKGDWDEGKYWLDQIISLCLARGWTYLIVPVPYEPVLLGRRRAGFYPGTISTILGTNALNFLDPSDGLLDDFLELAVEGERIGKRPYGCPLFNVHINDGHFSKLGSQSWARIVGRRLELLLERTQSLDDAMGSSEYRPPVETTLGQKKTAFAPPHAGANNPDLTGEER
jgi:hypothetical protein